RHPAPRARGRRHRPRRLRAPVLGRRRRLRCAVHRIRADSVRAARRHPRARRDLRVGIRVGRSRPERAALVTTFRTHPDPSTWDEALDDIGSRIRTAIVENRRHEIMYHVGRPGEDGFANRVLQAWGVDGHNSHTNVCSSSARLGHFLWSGDDRPSPDYANAKTILLLSSHLEAGHYFNPHAQRIMEAQSGGATLITIDPRLSNTSAKADLWLPAYSGTEGALLLAMARVLLDEELYDREFVRKWVDWRGYLRADRPDLAVTFENFIRALKGLYAGFTPEF